MATETFDKLRKDARAHELQLEQRLAAYARMDAAQDRHEARGDEEAGISPSELAESAAARDIEGLLEKLIDATDRMARIVAENPSRTSTAVVQRFREVTHDMKTTFRKQQANHRQRRDALKLLGRDGARGSSNGSDPSATDLLLRERSSLTTSNRAIDTILAQAAETRDALSRQRSIIMSSTGGLSGIAARMPGASQVIAAIQQRRIFNDRVTAAVIGVVLCFFVYWFVLRRM